jgi:RNA polymerase sigma-70 factor (ECF subfamily)
MGYDPAAAGQRREAAMDDFELLDAWAGGDTQAARELLKRYTGPLYRFFERKVEGPIEDMVQDTLVACVQGRDRFRREAGFRAYVFGIARHVLYAQLRAKHRGVGELDLESSCLREVGPTPSEIVAKKKEQQILLEALRHLPVETQVLLELYHWQGLTAQELADVVGIGERAVRSRLHRAKDALRDAVERVAHSPALLESTWADFEGWAKSLPRNDDG